VQSTVIDGIAIREAASTLELAQVRELFVEYAAWLQIDLRFQKFGEELAGLPGAYVRPRGRLLMADADGQAAGCVALRPLQSERGAEVGEVKRLWVRPPFRRTHIGRMLIARVLAEAREAGYRRLVLDTLPQMSAALALYRSAGFSEIPASYDNPIPGTVYLGLELD
jgi:ribosomal protein S18 acetylase RimI-like enzyme